MRNLLICLIFLAPAGALACGNEVTLSVDEQTRAVAKAEKFLEADEHGKALKTLLQAAQMSPMHARFGTTFTDEGLRARALRIAAAVLVRTDGTLSARFSAARIKRGGSEARTQLAWANRMLAEARAAAPEDPATAALVAEGLARTGEGVQAQALLEDLATRDVLPDAHGWRTLAVLRGAAGDAAGRDAALERCKLTAVKAKRCALKPGEGEPPATP